MAGAFFCGFSADFSASGFASVGFFPAVFFCGIFHRASPFAGFSAQALAFSRFAFSPGAAARIFIGAKFLDFRSVIGRIFAEIFPETFRKIRGNFSGNFSEFFAGNFSSAPRRARRENFGDFAPASIFALHRASEPTPVDHSRREKIFSKSQGGAKRITIPYRQFYRQLCILNAVLCVIWCNLRQ